MKRTNKKFLMVILAALALGACGDDDSDVKNDAGSDAGSTDKDSSVPGSDAGEKDAAVGGKDAAMNEDAAVADAATDAGTVQEFKVPTGGGEFTFTTVSGVEVTFDFPASAAGKDITIESIDPTTIDWANDDFEDAFGEVFKLEPDGTVFADPIKVTFANGAISALNFSDTGGVGEPLEVAADGESLLITHFSTLAVFPPTDLCDSVSAWTDDAASQRCTAHGTATTYRHKSAKCYKFCYTVEGGCCVDPTETDDPVDGCRLTAPNLTVVQRRVGPNGNDFPYCAEGLPTVATATGTLVQNGGDQTITLTGTFFATGGKIVINQDVIIPTVVNSATSATGTVPASYLTVDTALNSIAFVNPTWNAGGDCAVGSPSNCDFGNASSPYKSIDITPAAVTCLSGGTSLPAGNSGTCADPFMVDLRDAAIGTIVTKALLSSAGSDSAEFPASSSTQQCGLTSTARDIVFHVNLPVGADVDVSVSAATGSNAVLYFVESAACNANSIQDCNDSAGTNACEFFSAIHGTSFSQHSFYMAVSEGTASGSDLTVRFALRGTRTVPTITSATPNPSGPGQVIDVNLNNGVGSNANAVLSKSGSADVTYFCDPVSDNLCQFTVPANGGGSELPDGTYSLKLVYTDTAGAPQTNSVSFVKNSL